MKLFFTIKMVLFLKVTLMWFEGKKVFMTLFGIGILNEFPKRKVSDRKIVSKNLCGKRKSAKMISRFRALVQRLCQ